MRKLLQEISVVPGVIGSCIFDKKEGPVCKDLHPFLSEEILQTVGIHLVRLIQMGSMAELNIQSSHFHFDKYAVVGMPLETGAVLLTICEAQANCSLVATTAAMLAADMREELEKGVEVVEEDHGDLEDVAFDEVSDADMDSLYSEIEQALASTIGPIANVVMQDYLHKWKQSGPIIPARLNELVKSLEEEIGNPELVKEFSEKIRLVI